MEFILGEITTHIAHGHSHFCFVDDALSAARFRELSRRLRDAARDIGWICYLRLEPTHSFETFRLAREAGCRKVFFGLETGSTRLRRLYQKGSSASVALRVLTDASRAELAVHLFLMSGFPDESAEDRAATDHLLEDLLPKVDAFGFTYDVFPVAAELETPLYAHPSRFGAVGVYAEPDKDLAYRFRLRPKGKRRKSRESSEADRICQQVETSLKGEDGLRSLNISHDSMHLLLIMGRENSEDGTPRPASN